MDQRDYSSDEQQMRRVMRQVDRQRAIQRHPYVVTLSSDEAHWVRDRLLTPVRLESTSDAGHWLRLLKQQLDLALATPPTLATPLTSDHIRLIIPRYCVDQIATLQYAHVPGLPTYLALEGIEDVLHITGNPASPQVFEYEDDVRMAHHLAALMNKRGDHGRAEPFDIQLSLDEGDDIVSTLEADDALMDEIEAARTYLAHLGAAVICDHWPDPMVARIMGRNP